MAVSKRTSVAVDLGRPDERMTIPKLGRQVSERRFLYIVAWGFLEASLAQEAVHMGNEVEPHGAPDAECDAHLHRVLAARMS